MELFNEEIFKQWKQECRFDLVSIDKMMNLYEIKDFFHINNKFDENESEQLSAHREVLKSKFYDRRAFNRVFIVKLY